MFSIDEFIIAVFCCIDDLLLETTQGKPICCSERVIADLVVRSLLQILKRLGQTITPNYVVIQSAIHSQSSL
jgi:hypothetical protein